MKPTDFAKDHIKRLQPYSPGKPIEELERELGVSKAIKLASNENPLGPSPRAVEAIRRAATTVNRYPDGASYRLREALAAKLDIPPQTLVFGTGSDEILELLAKTFVGPGDEVVFPWPSFAMYPLVAQGMGATPVGVPLDSTFHHDLTAMSKAVGEKTRMLFVCSPNNPTGTSVGRSEFDAFAADLPESLLLVIDEAYVEYVEHGDALQSERWVRERPGTISLRTFSKIYGLAGLRLGYGFGDSELVSLLERARHPFNVNLLGEAGALAALEDEDHLERSRRENARGREQLASGLAELGIEAIPSDANFVLAECGPGTYDALLKKGVIVRPMAGFGLSDHIRVTVGTREENERFLTSLADLRPRRG